MEQDKIYQRIGEFVVCFQFVENLLREIGWFILDPAREQWPPESLRDETSYQLAEKVKSLFQGCIGACELPHENEFRESFDKQIEIFHEIRKQRNKFLHSAYIELKAGGEVQALLRSDPILEKDSESGEPTMNQETLSANSFEAEMKKIGELLFNLGMLYKQLIHRLPTTVEM
jgi:hypothetical protein